MDVNRVSSICLVRLWYGPYPPYLNCVLRSCEENPDIDWLIITENLPPAKIPPNVHFHHLSLAEVLRRFTAKLGFEPAPPDVNTDLKAALGFVFDDLLAGYDFWGHCDFDVIFGDLRKFLTEDILKRHHKIFSRGHLTLYQNIEKVNRAFMLESLGTVNYKEAFKKPGTTQFDEMQGINLIFRHHNFSQFRGDCLVDVAPPSRWKITRFEGTALHNFHQQVFYWYRGKIFHAYFNCDRDLVDDEYAYIHFQKRAMPAPDFDPFAAVGFLITPDGFFPYNREPLTDEDFARYNCERWRTRKEIFQMITRAFRKRLGFRRVNDFETMNLIRGKNS